MREAPETGRVVRFGVFEADLAAGELRCRGLKVKLQDRPFQILVLLLGRPGQIVTREELRNTLWPADVFVDFDNSINTAVNKLREALGDSAENPRFIETVGRRGYRWIPDAAPSSEPERLATGEAHAGGGLRLAARGSAAEGASSLPLDRLRPPQRGESESLLTSLAGRGRRVALLVAGTTFILTALASFWWFSPSPVPRVIRSIQITRSGRVETWGRIVTDGGRVYYLEREGHHWNLVQTSTTGGEAQPVPAPFQNTRILDISPDQTEFLLGSFIANESRMPLWIMPVAGGSPRRVGEVIASDAIWCPDGQRILYAKGFDLYLAGRDGANSRKFVATGGAPRWPAWSPNKRTLRFTVWDPTYDSYSLWEVAADGTGLHPLLPGWSNPPADCCGRWMSDGRYFLFSSAHGGTGNIWALRETGSLFRRPRPQPVQLTTGPTDFSGATPSKDGKRLFVSGKQPQVELVRYDAKARQFQAFLAGTRVWWVSFSGNREWMAYVTTPESTLWRSRVDGSDRLQLTFLPLKPVEPHWSRDQKQIAFWTAPSGGTAKIYLVSSEGGPPREVAPEWGNRARPDWSPDGGSLVFEVSGDSSAPGSPANALYTVNLRTNEVSKLAGSEGLIAPRWSPDGRYLAALTADERKLMAFDFKTRQWAQWAQGTSLTSLFWSRDGKDLYFQDSLAAGEPVYRLRASDHRRERVPGCEKLQIGILRCALAGLDPDDAPVLQLIRRWADIYALDLDLP